MYTIYVLGTLVLSQKINITLYEYQFSIFVTHLCFIHKYIWKNTQKVYLSI